ncbi:MAG: sugar phosphate isomerase/epimerase, partial [Parabacteroides sp.]|nr:sugar phosphate isomerase/epimerase [Parabacteroides sp.]
LAQPGRLRLDYYQIRLEDPDTINPHTIVPALAEAGVSALVCGAFGPARDISSEDAGVRRQGVLYIKKCIDIASALHSPLLSGPMYSATGKARLLAPSEKNQQWSWAVENMKECAAYASDKGVKLAVETLNRFETDFLNTVDQGLEFLDRIDSQQVGFLLDTFHMNIEETDLPASLRKAGSKIFNFHACSNTRGTPGEDHINWQGIVAALREVKYSGPVVIESFTTEITEIAKAVSLWRPLAESQDALAANGLAFLQRIFG